MALESSGPTPGSARTFSPHPELTPFGPAPELNPPGAFALSLISPVSRASGKEIYEEYAGAGSGREGTGSIDSGSGRIGGYNCHATDPVAITALQELIRDSGASDTRAEQRMTGYEGLLFVTSTRGLANSLAAKCEAAPGECCVFVDTSAGPGTELVTFVLGVRARETLALLVREPGSSSSDPRVGRWVAALLTDTVARPVREFASTDRVNGVNLTVAVPLLGFGFALYTVCELVAVAARNMFRSAESTPLLTKTSSALQAPLDDWVSGILRKETQERYASDDGTGDRSEILNFDIGTLSLSTYAPDALNDLNSFLRSAWSRLPDAAWAFGVLAEELKANYAQSRPMEQAKASWLFQQGVLRAVLNAPNVGGVMLANATTAWQRRDQLWDLATIGSITGVTSFLAGTIYGVLYDICETVGMLVYYSFVGIRWVFYQDLKMVQSLVGGDETPPASDATVASWFPAVDLDLLFSQDLPELYATAKSFSNAIRDNFISNAEEWGEMVGEYLMKALGTTMEKALTLAFEPWDATAGYLERVWYVVRQWFYLGSVLGPILIDIVLTFCTGGTEGVVSGVLKLGKVMKIEKLTDLFRVNTVGTEVVRELRLFGHVVAAFPDDLARMSSVVTRVFGNIWDAVGPVRNQLMSALTALEKATPDELEWWAKTIDELYDAASTINFLVGLLLLITGTSSVDKRGELVEAPV